MGTDGEAKAQSDIQNQNDDSLIQLVPKSQYVSNGKELTEW